MKKLILIENEETTRAILEKVLFMIRGGGQVPNMAKLKMKNPPISYYFH